MRSISNDVCDQILQIEHFISLNCTIYHEEAVICGVPQSSFYARFLICIPICIQMILTMYLMTNVLFLNDINKLNSRKANNNIKTIVNNELNKIQKWLFTNKLSINLLKPNYMFLITGNINLYSKLSLTIIK